MSTESPPPSYHLRSRRLDFYRTVSRNSEVARFKKKEGKSWDQFLFYLNRHIESDCEHHGPMSRELVARLCGDDERLWKEAEQTARACLQSRLDLWDHIAACL